MREGEAAVQRVRELESGAAAAAAHLPAAAPTPAAADAPPPTLTGSLRVCVATCDPSQARD